ncbi:MAG: FixJ family two-component response regulator [Verrucomicrobiales bacterium]|jgi:FixJ family two-component response regulator
MTPADPTVFLVDDDPSVLKGLSRLLRSSGHRVEAFDSPREFLREHDPQAAGCLVLDLAMPGLTGLELQQALAEKGCALPIIFLTGRGDIPSSVTALKRGAADFLTKPIHDACLLAAVAAAIEKDRVAREERARLDEIRSRFETLTPREKEVMLHVVSGHLNKQIAGDLGTVEKTIKVHRSRVMAKMGVKSLAELVWLAERLAISPKPPKD